ncbi:S-layer homology domain-containing protein [Paenibacillus sp. FSL E2-0201]|uniref:S-layer homology domain-containing protein n=1 Tax=Paenibacillus sp. FSL E2-0201 TaxID=2954726 RepID=UPI0030DD96A8
MKKRLIRVLSISILSVIFLSSIFGSAFAASGSFTVADSTITSSDLADNTATQQRWLSVPESRIVMNPGNHPDSGPHFPLGSGYYVEGKAKGQDRLLEIFHASGMAPLSSSEHKVVAFDEPFDNLTANHWITSGVSAVSEEGKAITTVTTPDGWGSISSKTITVNLTDSPYLSVTVPSSTGKWALKIDKNWQRVVQNDTSATGTFTYDLRNLADTRELTGTQSFKVMLFASGGTGKTAFFDSLQFYSLPAGAEFPADGKMIRFEDNFDGLVSQEWSTASSYGNGVTITSDGNLGSVIMGSDAGYGAVERQVTVNVSETPSLSVKIPATTGKWAIKLNTGQDGDAYVLQTDTSATGVFTYDLAGITGWEGSRTFKIKLYQIGAKGTSTKIDRLSIHADDRWLNSAVLSTSTWRPEAMDFYGEYADGTITGSDLFFDRDSITRTVISNLTQGAVAVAGEYAGSVSYDTAKNVLIIVDNDKEYTRAIALPQGTIPLFFNSESDMRLGRNSITAPPSPSGYWAAVMPGQGSNAIGVGFAVGGDASAAAEAVIRGKSAASLENAALSRADWKDYWDEFLAKIPAVEDFAIRNVDTVGVTSEDVKKMYYMAWIDLDQNVLPATPERGGSHRQIATGKPSMYTSGPHGAEASASWDSLFGMQYMAYIDPELAWESFEGMMSAVEANGALGGESLPARKAQTAWILYQVTGDKVRLEGLYDSLARHLRWSADNLRWNFGDGGEQERDAEFVVSLIIDDGYARQIAEVLNKPADVSEWTNAAAGLTQNYKDWFFPQEGTTLYKHWLDGSHSDDTGLTMYVSTGLHVPDLPDYYVGELIKRFQSEYNPAVQLAGLGNEALKAPDAQFMTYGLLDQGKANEASVLINAFTRDIVRTKTFAEVYQKSSDDITAMPIARSVYPSLFGNIHLIDNLWISNGYRMDLGVPAFVRMPGANGGISGLTWMGKLFEVNIDGEVIRLSGEATKLPGACTSIRSQVGQTIQWDGSSCILYPPIPAAPADLTGMAYDQEVSLRWSPADHAESYKVYQYEVPTDPNNPNVWETVGSGITGSSYKIEGLTNGTSYAFAVKAVNAAGESPFSQAVIAVPTAVLPDAPDAPDRLNAVAGDGQVILNWNAMPRSVTYTVYRFEGTEAPLDPAQWIEVDQAVQGTSYTVTGLTNGLSYVFAVKAANPGGVSGFSGIAAASPVAALPQLPQAPDHLSATAGNGQVTLNWNAVAGTVSYAVYKHEGTSAPEIPGAWVLVKEGITGTSYTVTGLTNGTSYAFAVKAANPEGASELSGAATAVPVLPQPEPPVEDNPNPSPGQGTPPVTDNSVIKSATGTITLPAGRAGEVSLGDQVTISVPAGAAEQELRITIAKVADIAQLSKDQGTLVSEVFEVLKNLSGTFKHPVTLSLKFDPAAVKAGQRVAIFYYDEAQKVWVEVGGKVEGSRITAEVDHFTKFAVLAVDVKTEEGSEQPQPLPNFTDIAGHWAETLIRSAAGLKLAGGYPDGSFQPNKSVTRAEFTVMLMNALKSGAAGSASTFKDQEKIGAWAAEAVAQAASAGIVSGYEDGSFRPNAVITRAEMAVMIAKALGLPLEPAAGTSFTDDAKIPAWAKAAVKGIHALGILEGRGAGRFAPSEQATRAEAVTMLLRMLEHKE